MRKKNQIQAKSLETFALEVIFGERHDFTANVTRVLLFALSKVFHTLVNVRRWFFNNSF